MATLALLKPRTLFLRANAARLNNAFTGPASPSTDGIDASVFGGELMPLSAVCLGASLRCGCDGARGSSLAAPLVFLPGNGFEVFRVAAMPNTANMVQFVTFRDGSFEVGVDDPVEALHLTLIANDGIAALGKQARPEPAVYALPDLDL